MEHQKPVPDEQVINVSGIQLTTSQTAVLSKGLTFTPINKTKEFQTKVNLFKFHHSLQLKLWYHTNPIQAALRSETYQSTTTVFKPKSMFMPNICNPILNAFYKKVTYEVDKLFTSKKKVIHNLSNEEKEALNWLSTNENIVIKRADKGGGVVVWGRDQYITEAMRQLSNREYYIPLQSNPLPQLLSELTKLLTEAKNED